MGSLNVLELPFLADALLKISGIGAHQHSLDETISGVIEILVAAVLAVMAIK